MPPKNTMFEVATLIPAAVKRTRNSKNSDRQLTISKCRTTNYQTSYFVRAAKLWNILPCEFTLEGMTLLGFKTKLIIYYKDALRVIYDVDDYRTWKTICIKCRSACLLLKKPNCCN